MILHWPIRTGSDSISADQNWTRTEKFVSPLISGRWQLSRRHSSLNPVAVVQIR